MDKYTPRLLDLGMKGMVGKGRRSPEVIAAMRRNHAVYFAAVGGAGAALQRISPPEHRQSATFHVPPSSKYGARPSFFLPPKRIPPIDFLSKCIKKAETVAYEDLGTEAVRRLVVEEFPVIVVIDAEGTDLYGNLSG